MKTLEITDEQYAFIQRLRQEISEEVVGKYGFVRERDAVQFLIDNIDGEADVDIEIDEAFHSSATDDVAGSVGAAIEADGESVGEEVSYDETADPADPDEAEDDDDTDESNDSSTNTDDSSVESGGGEGDADSSDNGSESESGDADDDEMLDEMMSLLETHDDKWEESSSADYRYTVTLPDGSTEDVQTKDDVRALLFKNYR
ncbi:hypothetical protein [Halopiger aswanensis]|uniref:Uncharacterized protein n=1 Tax=Halopiger aswanensis TaxID=148449 RepID=A0A3R7FX06_9EURY|nr:hypothetical protein [Halopiger aswanensis]RKD97156.1 hypothetical protein ATJ93_0137 [Halopiger aswanensis]